MNLFTAKTQSNLSVPLEFPSDPSQIKKPNVTELKRLLHNTTSTSTTLPTENNITNKIMENQINFSSVPTLSTVKAKHNPKDDAEPIQFNGENSEDEQHPLLIRTGEVMSPQRTHGPGVPLVRGQLAAILAGIFVVLAVGGYIALLSWRRYLE